jgi:hypothetical protein
MCRFFEPGPRQELHPATVDAGGHPKAVQFYLMQPLRPDGGFSTGWESCGRIKVGRGEARRLLPGRDEPDLTACETGRSKSYCDPIRQELWTERKWTTIRLPLCLAPDA